MAGQPPFAVHISLTVSTKSVYVDLAERLLVISCIAGSRPTCTGPIYHLALVGNIIKPVTHIIGAYYSIRTVLEVAQYKKTLEKIL
jgi:hypothetical protein